MIIYKRSFDENREIYFLHRKRKNFYCIFKTLEKIRNIKAGKKHERRLSIFICTSNID